MMGQTVGVIQLQELSTTSFQALYWKFDERKFVNDVQKVIEEFLKKFNPFRNNKSMPDIYDAYNLLQNNNLLKNQFEIIEYFVYNYKIYGYKL